MSLPTLATAKVSDVTRKFNFYDLLFISVFSYVCCTVREKVLWWRKIVVYIFYVFTRFKFPLPPHKFDEVVFWKPSRMFPWQVPELVWRILFMFSVQEFNYHRSVSVNMDVLPLKIGALLTDPKTQNSNLLITYIIILFRFFANLLIPLLKVWPHRVCFHKSNVTRTVGSNARCPFCSYQHYRSNVLFRFSTNSRYPSNRPWRPIGLWDVEASTFSKQSAHRLRWGCPPYASAALYPQEGSWYSFLLEAELTPGPQCAWKD
jgi:hypothetical protein